jgi:tRNA(Ile)-lysidine synthase
VPGDLTADPVALFAPVAGRRGVGLAVSGGPDSLALLLLAAAWRRQCSTPPLFVYSVDHGLRAEAADEVRFVLETARHHHLPARGLRWEGPRPTSGIQAAARQARYRLMRDAMAADGADVLVTAHHLGDQAETVLMRLAHGSGIEGLRGMDRLATVEGCDLFRPLLGVAPDRLGQIVTAAGLTPVSDPSNLDDDYERVRWRRMLPLLAAQGLDAERLSRFARRMGEADAMIERQADAAREGLVRAAGPHACRIEHAGFARLDRPVAVRLLARVLADVGGQRKPHALGAIETLHDKLMLPTVLRRASLHGCLVGSDGTEITVNREGARRRSGAGNVVVTRN